MYHYVRPNSEEYPFFRNLNLESFKNQLDYFQDNIGFLSKEEYKDSIKTGISKRGVVLTFDDGFKDHHEYVLPELQRRGLWGIFYIPIGQYKTNKLLGVHRVHYLKGKYGSDFVLKKVLNKFGDLNIDGSLIQKFDNTTYHYFDRDDTEKTLQRLLNYYLDYPTRDRILDSMMADLFDESVIFDDLYLNENEIKNLEKAGNIIGPHTVNHKVLSRLTYDEQFLEIKESVEFLMNILDMDYKSFCYPYGYPSSYNHDTLKIIETLGFDDACIFDNVFSNKDINKYEMSRVDCNQFLQIK